MKKSALIEKRLYEPGGSRRLPGADNLECTALDLERGSPPGSSWKAGTCSFEGHGRIYREA